MLINPITMTKQRHPAPASSSPRKKNNIQIMKRLLLHISGMAAATALVSAVPVPVSGPLAGPGNGLNFRAVQFSPSIVHNIAQAEAALALNPGDPNYVGELNSSVNHIDVADGDYGGEITASHDAAPFGPGDPLFAVRFSGFLNVLEAGNYVFRSYTDDGFQLTLGGEEISAFDADRAPATSLSPVVALVPGLYEIDFVSWEQGGLFVNELSWQTPGATSFSVPDSQVFFRSAGTQVPDGGTTAALLGCTGIIMLLVSRRSRRK